MHRTLPAALSYPSSPRSSWIVSLLALALTTGFSAPAAAVTFTPSGAALTGVNGASAAWGDYDNDGDLDVLITGLSGTTKLTKLYRNSGGVNPTFADVGAGLTGVWAGSAAWGDYDNDGDLDVVITGADAGNTGIAKLYRNSGGPNPTFADAAVGLTGVDLSSVAWGDYDNDGDLDLLLTGRDAGDNRIAKLYRNNGGANPSFSEVSVGLPGVSVSSVAWGDYDKDGNPDVLIAGVTVTGGVSSYISRVYRNSGGPNPTFTDIAAGLLGVGDGSVAWGDYDNDGNLDILLSGHDAGGPHTLIYQNFGGPNPTFGALGTALTGVSNSSVAWGDYDNDGDLDFLLTGSDASSTKVSIVYENTGGGSFSDAQVGLTGIFQGSATWVDYDNDGDLDALIAGQSATTSIATLYRSSTAAMNTAPSTPTGLSATCGDGVTFSWNAASDTQTPAAGLTYNLRVGSVTGGNQISPSMSLANGYRQVVRAGSAGQRLSWTLHLPPGVYYWSVQAVDGAFMGSAFAAEPSLFADIGAGLTGVHQSSVAWGDYDNDGDLDFVLIGFTGSVGVAKIYQNSGGSSPTFTDIGAGLTPVYQGSAAWADYDNDGDVDLLLTGFSLSAGGPTSTLYRNNGGGSFTNVGAGLVGVQQSSVAWGDYDNDGDLDLLLTGDNSSFQPVTKLYRNSGGINPVFADAGAALDNVEQSSVAWGDYDNDGDLDILLTGLGSGVRVAKVYRNSGGPNPTFSDIAAGLTTVYSSSVAWGDYDNDGDLDILLTGFTSAARISKIYRNNGGVNPTFTDVGAALEGVNASSIGWGDYDNNGTLDILLTGFNGTGRVTHVYKNGGGVSPTFSDFATGLPGLQNSSVAWGDFDNDGDLDILATGYDPGNIPTSRVYRNGLCHINAPPAAPGNLSAVRNGGLVTFSWTPGIDDHTPVSALSYNLRVGTTLIGEEVMPAMAHPQVGTRRIVQMGNVGQSLSWTLALPPGGYYYAVQAIDHTFLGSPFSGSTVAVEDTREPPSIFELGPAAPNPFTNAVDLSFALPQKSRVELAIFDLQGRRLRILERGEKPAGRHRAQWDGRDESGARRSDGVYLARMTAAGKTWTKKIVLAH